ncbi:S8 family peptidase [Actinophytocola oryzae]|uniref:Subtilase family protein n=1 Tax=Actinophytocola oryzae TaxID=502181 RepID=A0A4R7VSK1_9PSEU|nr:S8 family peptidase [Actinophytocola oryzae]TDV52488.1 subtilase family protein [Actinophytocola oryzae]
MIYKRALPSLLAAVLAVGVVAPSAWAAPDAAGAVAASGAGPTVTLLTGDKVTLGGMRGVTVRAAKGREQIAFFTREDEQGDTHVIPSDAVTPLSQGTLDPRLFDVTELVRAKYDDASRTTLPLIVDFGGRTPRAAGAQVSRELPAMGATAVSADRSATFWATARTAEHVWLDGPVRASLDHSVPQIGAPAAWAAGHTGAGTTVAVLDTGIDVSHPDLADAVTGAQNFSDAGDADDHFGHGTHVASIITGSGAASGGTYKGVAPDTRLLNGKVLNDFGGGQESWIIAGMEWAARSGADVVNMSLGTGDWSDGTDPMSQAVNRLTAETGALFVVASGNSGYLVGSPAAADSALTVGAVDRDDQLAEFSSRGRIDEVLKPDITAPGVDIVAAKAANGMIGDPAADGYVSLSGTSMATPHVAGAAAILAGEHPDWTPDQLKATLMGSAEPTGGVSVYDQGAGRVDVAKATTSTVSASPASISNGVVQWPHDDDQPVAKTLTYTNTGTEPVTLDLSDEMTGPGGTAAPSGMFTISPASLTVPAGGQASATITTDTRVEAPDGQYGGEIIATGSGQTVRTPFAVTREVESYDVTVRFLDHNGSATENYFYRFVDVNNPKAYLPYDPSGTVVVRLPKGEFYFEATVQTEKAPSDYLFANFAEPAFTVTGDTSLTVDAREAQKVAFTVDRPDARTGTAMFQFALETDWGPTGTTAYIPNFDDFSIKPSTTSKKGRFTFTAEERMAAWNGTSFDGSPYLYNVRHVEDGVVPSTLRWTVHDRQLAKVRAEYAAATPDAYGRREYFVTMKLPATLTEYYTPDVPWDAQFDEISDPSGQETVSTLLQAAPKVYKRGATTRERWNVGVYGPAWPDTSAGYYFAARLGDDTRLNLPMATDQGTGRAGFAIGEGSTTLLRNGEVIAEDPYPGGGGITLDPEVANYTLRSTLNRTGARLSTVVSGEWTFRSGHVDGDDPAQLPLLAVRFRPNLDDHNFAPAGRRFSLPVTVERNGGPVGRVSTPVVEVSYDDGATWRPVRVTRDHDQWQATVDHPRGAAFVSLRASTGDQDGNSTKETIIRAYALK